ncbi:MAG: hypothetical protein ACI8O8_001754 [Oleiphilaceae bacterium]|jgi:hypothetical protein
MNERNDIDHPIWRKKVDNSFLNNNVTPIPKWLWPVWQIEALFLDCNSKKNTQSIVSVHFEGAQYSGNVTITNQTKRFCRLSFDKSLHTLLKERFLMSYMRSLEGNLRKVNGYSRDIELEIPFWEFIDIEFDTNRKAFIFTAYYTQKPIFPELFKRMVSSPSIKKVDNEINNKNSGRIEKQDWRPREKYREEIVAENIIYTLVDTVNKLIYIGEAKKLIPRFDNGHPDIKDWDYYKYNVLPESLEEHRLTIERMAIRDMASFLKNKADIPNVEISLYKLANRKIDNS